MSGNYNKSLGSINERNLSINIGNNMTHITKLTGIVGGRLLPSDKKLSASLLEVSGSVIVTGKQIGRAHV